MLPNIVEWLEPDPTQEPSEKLGGAHSDPSKGRKNRLEEVFCLHIIFV
jgi:hypothetical protein